MRGRIAAAVVTVATVGCASVPPQMTRDQYLATTTRIYKAPKDDVIAAAEKVLRLADGNDFKLAHNADGFTASRAWSIYMVLAATFGNDYWSVKVTERDGASMIETQVASSSQALAPMATTSPGTWTTSTLPGGSSPVDGPALYELFFARMDYMLGLRPDWPTCKWSDQRVRSKATWGVNEALCNSFNVKDDTPTAPLAAR